MYNPYNSRNKLLSLKDIQTILTTYKCSFNIKNLKLFQNAMIHSSYVRREEYTSPTGEKIKLAKGETYIVSDELSSHRSISEKGVKLLIIDGDFLKLNYSI